MTPEETPQTSERRAFVRYPRRLEMLWQFLGVAPRDLSSAAITDLSANGVGLMADREFPAGTLLMIRLPTATQGWNTLLIRVRNCQWRGERRYHVGCTFARPLRAEQLRALLA